MIDDAGCSAEGGAAAGPCSICISVVGAVGDDASVEGSTGDGSSGVGADSRPDGDADE
jgi:hypothetical protein